jgi:hypothetical protein
MYSGAAGALPVAMSTVDLWQLVQWPAMLVTVVASWLVASNRQERRNSGFWWFLASNVLWIIWGIHDHAWALICLQLLLAGMNVRGMRKTG